MKKTKNFLFCLSALFLLIGCNTPEVTIQKDGALPGKFSVSPSQMVQFSQGNLQYFPYLELWKFADEQYEVLKDANFYINGEWPECIDLFGWGTGNTPCQVSIDNADYPTFIDWGVNAISNGGNTQGAWRTLSGEEWNYLFAVRPNAEDLYTTARIIDKGDTVMCMLVLPDDWTDPESVPLEKGFTRKWNNKLSFQQWDELQKAGAVMLPMDTGRREHWFLDGIEGFGYYWSSSLHKNSGALMLVLARSYLPALIVDQFNGVNTRFQGCAVRLVKDVN